MNFLIFFTAKPFSIYRNLTQIFQVPDFDSDMSAEYTNRFKGGINLNSEKFKLWKRKAEMDN